jgi:hypothetical protein
VRRQSAPLPAAPLPLDLTVPISRKPAAPGTAGALKRAAAALPAVVDLLGKPDFEPTPELAAHIEKAGAPGADVRVRLGNLSSVSIVRVKKSGRRYVTVEDAPQVVPLSHALFVPAPGLSPVVRVRIGAGGSGSAITGYLAPASSPGSTSALARSITADPSALGLRGFELPHAVLENTLSGGTLAFGTKKPTRFELGGWVSGDLAFGLVNQAVTFEAAANLHARGLRDAELRLSRDGRGQIQGSARLAVDLGDRFTGSATATYRDGDVAISGELSYASEKFRGKLGLMVADVAAAEQMVRAQLDPLGVQPIAGVGGAGGAKPAPIKGKKGERGIAGWGALDFAFTDWLVGRAQVVYGPTGHLTVVGKIAPPQRLDLMKSPKGVKKPIVPETRIEASYGLPYIADVHVGIGVSLSANAELGPIYMTDLGIEGVYSTDPSVMNAFSITGALRAQAQAGLSLDVKGYAGLRILKHSVNFGAAIKGDAGIKAYAEARPTLGYREVASPSAGKQGEYYLKGHLEMAAQPVLALGGRLFVELDSPWWSPAPDKTWEWPLGKLEYPLPTQLGVGADIDYVVGSGQWPELKLTQPSFNPGKFVDTLMDDKLPAKSGRSGTQQKQGQWQGVAPAKPTAAPPSVAKRPAAEPKVAAGGASAKQKKGKQTPDEKKNVPKSQDAAARWNAGMEALGELRKRSEQDPETQAEIQRHLAELKARHGFTKLSADRAGDLWLVDAAMNPEKKDIPIKADPKEKPGDNKDQANNEDVQVKTLVEPAPASVSAKGQLAADIVKTTSGQVLFDNGADAKTAAKAVLRDHKDARFDKTTGTLTLPPVKSPNPSLPLLEVAKDVAQQTGVSRVTVQKAEHGVTLRGEINPWTPLATVQGDAGTTAERLQLAQAVQEFHQEFTPEQWMKHFALEKSQAYADLSAAQTLTPPQISKVRHGKYQLAGPAWTHLKAEIISRFKLTARGVITAVPFGILELEHLCEHDPKLPKECPEYKDVAKMTEVLDALIAERAVRKTLGGKYEFTPVPPQRFLPAGWTGEEVRRYYYENGSGFGSVRDKMCQRVRDEVVAVIAQHEAADNLRASGKIEESTALTATAASRWQELYDDEKVSSQHAAYPNTPEWKAKYSASASYHADHVEPLAWLWEFQNQNNAKHEERLAKAGGLNNLRPMWGPDNSGKGAKGPDGRAGEYMRKPWVGPDFTGPATSGDSMDAGYGAAFRVSM